MLNPLLGVSTFFAIWRNAVTYDESSVDNDPSLGGGWSFMVEKNSKLIPAASDEQITWRTIESTKRKNKKSTSLLSLPLAAVILSSWKKYQCLQNTQKLANDIN